MADKANKHIKKEKQESPSAKKRPDWQEVAKLVVLLSVLGLSIFLFAGYLDISKTSTIIGKQLGTIEKMVARDHQQIANLEQNASEVKGVVEKAKTLTAKQAQLIDDWQAAQNGDMSRWQMAEARHLVALANQQALYLQDFKLASFLLHRASEVLLPLSSQQAQVIKRSIASDLARLQQVAVIDQQAVYLQLTAITQAIKQLPFNKDIITDAAQPAQNNANNPQANSWWQAGWNDSVQALKQIIVVKQLKPDTVPLSLPDEKALLYANIESRLNHAIWATLHHDATIYETSLSMVNTWINQYFDLNATATKLVLQKIQSLRSLNVSNPDISFRQTLKLFEENTLPATTA